MSIKRVGRSAGVVAMGCFAVAGMPRSAWAEPWIEFIPDFQVAGMSADGSTVVGTAVSRNAPAQWRRDIGVRRIPLMPGFTIGRAWSASRDGSIVVGRTGVQGGVQLAWRWTEAGGTVALQDLPGGSEIGEAVSISEDGNLIVGTGRIDHVYAVVWRAPFVGPPESLGTVDIPGYTSSTGGAISGDGSTVVATATQQVAVAQAAIWRPATGMLGLGDLPGGPELSLALACSRDGGVVVGFGRRYNEAQRQEAFRWDAQSGMVGLGYMTPEPARSSAYGVSGDGMIVVGEAGPSAGQLDAFIWSSDRGMRSLADVLRTAYGLDLGDRALTRGQAISSDGRTIAGSARAPGGIVLGFVVHIDPICPADLDDGTFTGRRDGGVSIDDLLYFLSLYAEGLIGADLDNGTFTGTPDGGVTLDDLAYFLFRYEQGC